MQCCCQLSGLASPSIILHFGGMFACMLHTVRMCKNNGWMNEGNDQTDDRTDTFYTHMFTKKNPVQYVHVHVLHYLWNSVLSLDCMQSQKSSGPRNYVCCIKYRIYAYCASYVFWNEYTFFACDHILHRRSNSSIPNMNWDHRHIHA